MKKINKLSFFDFEKNKIEKTRQQSITGGIDCCMCYTTCGCLYAGSQEGPDDPYWGGSSIEDNRTANSGPLTYSVAASI